MQFAVQMRPRINMCGFLYQLPHCTLLPKFPSKAFSLRGPPVHRITPPPSLPRRTVHNTENMTGHLALDMVPCTLVHPQIKPLFLCIKSSFGECKIVAWAVCLMFDILVVPHGESHFVCCSLVSRDGLLQCTCEMFRKFTSNFHLSEFLSGTTQSFLCFS